MLMWKPSLLEGDGPLYRRIYRAIARMIHEGVLKPGIPLPSSRALAAQLGVSRNSVVKAYELLAIEGLVRIEPRKGFLVVKADSPWNLSAPRPKLVGWDPGWDRDLVSYPEDLELFGPFPGPLRTGWLRYDFWPGYTDPRLFPRKRWQEVLNRLLYKDTRGLFTAYTHPQGLPILREAIATYLGAALGLSVDPGEVLITNGSQEAIYILAQLLQARERPAVVEDPCYRGAYTALGVCGAKLVPIPIDTGGLTLDGMPESASLAYVTPSHQYPTGVVMNQKRRYELVAWANRVGAYILEDGYDSEFWYEGLPPPALWTMDKDRVIYLGTFSKVLGAGIRLGYALLPRALIRPAVAIKAALNTCSPPFLQAAVAEFICSGTLQRHLYEVRRAYHVRRNALLRALKNHLGHLRIKGQQGGLHLMALLPQAFPSAPEWESHLETQGVGVYSLSKANAWASEKSRGLYSHAVFLGFGGLNEQEIREAVRIMGEVLRERLPAMTSMKRQ